MGGEVEVLELGFELFEALGLLGELPRTFKGLRVEVGKAGAEFAGAGRVGFLGGGEKAGGFGGEGKGLGAEGDLCLGEGGRGALDVEKFLHEVSELASLGVGFLYEKAGAGLLEGVVLAGGVGTACEGDKEGEERKAFGHGRYRNRIRRFALDLARHRMCLHTGIGSFHDFLSLLAYTPPD